MQGHTPPVITYHDPLDSFTDRESILALFEQFLAIAQPGRLRLLAIKGNSGTGKTFLISYLATYICPKRGWQSGHISFAQASMPDFRSVAMGLEQALKGCVSRRSLKDYRSKRDEYNRRFDEYRTSITINQHVEAQKHSSISAVNQSVTIDTQLRRRELQLRAELSRALIELAEESEQPLCLFLDNYERLIETDPEIAGWLWQDLLFGLAKTAPQPLVVVTCGWERPSDDTISPFTHSAELTDFDLEQIKSYLEKQRVIPINTDLATLESKELIAAFYKLTRGHPLVLGLAVTYFNTLERQERTAASLEANRPLLNDRAQVEFLEERLLSRLSEPYRTLLEKGPILRSFNQEALQELLLNESTAAEASKLDDRTYDHFLRYPFINRQSVLVGNVPAIQLTFHDLVRQVRLEELRHHHPQTKKHLHRKMADYYKKLIDVEQTEQFSDAILRFRQGELRLETTEKEFTASLEWFYHSLQVEELQPLAFEEWQKVIWWMINRWRRQRAETLLALIRQLVEEGEPYLSKTSYPYGQYLLCSSRYLEQEARWNEAVAMAEEAIKIFEQEGTPTDLAIALNNIGNVYQQQGKLEQALRYYERALALYEKANNNREIITTLNNIGSIYSHLGKQEQALLYVEQACTLSKILGDPLYMANSFNNMGSIYRKQGKLEQALHYFEQGCTICNQEDNPIWMATFLNHMGEVYQTQGMLEQALSHFEQALSISKEVGDPNDLAASLNNIGIIYQKQGKLEQALLHYEQALNFKEQLGNPTSIATALNNIGEIYKEQGKLEQALNYLKRALVLYEQTSAPEELAITLNNISSIYQRQGKLEQALNYLEQALAQSKQTDNLAVTALAYHNLGQLYRQRGQLKDALRYYEQALVIRERLGNPADLADTLDNIGSLFQFLKDFKRSLKYHMEALTLRRQVHNPAALALSLNNVGTIFYAQKQWEQALSYFEESLALRMNVGDPAECAESNNNIGYIYLGLGDLSRALNYLEHSLTLREQVGDPRTIAISLVNIGAIHRRQGNLASALSHYERAFKLFEEAGDAIYMALSLHNMGVIYQQQGSITLAIEQLNDALRIYERLGPGFESDVAQEMEILAVCYAMLRRR